MTTTSLQGQEDIPWIRTIVAAMGVGVIAIAVYALFQRSFTVFACALLIALAAAMAGALLGFIFGIPKTVTTNTTNATAVQTEYKGNSNLEQISDWLTKILVGAGLVQLGAIRQAFKDFGSQLDSGGCLGNCGWIAGPALVIVYSVAGFLLAYLWARIYMAKALMSEQ